MRKIFLVILCLALAATALPFVPTACAKQGQRPVQTRKTAVIKNQPAADTVKMAIMGIINTVVKASSTFDIDKVADLYTPNAVVADEEPPFSWNGTTAGIQWVNTVEKTVKDMKISRFGGKILPVSVFLVSGECIYTVVPVNYTGEIKGDTFEEDGVFTFIFRIVNGKWLIKSQVWVSKKGM